MSPTLGRFTTPDPLGVQPDVNYYRFVGNNSLTRVDPLGFEYLNVQMRVHDVDTAFPDGLILSVTRKTFARVDKNGDVHIGAYNQAGVWVAVGDPGGDAEVARKYSGFRSGLSYTSEIYSTRIPNTHDAQVVFKVTVSDYTGDQITATLTFIVSARCDAVVIPKEGVVWATANWGPKNYKPLWDNSIWVDWSDTDAYFGYFSITYNYGEWINENTDRAAPSDIGLGGR